MKRCPGAKTRRAAGRPHCMAVDHPGFGSDSDSSVTVDDENSKNVEGGRDSWSESEPRLQRSVRFPCVNGQHQSGLLCKGVAVFVGRRRCGCRRALPVSKGYFVFSHNGCCRCAPLSPRLTVVLLPVWWLCLSHAHLEERSGVCTDHLVVGDPGELVTTDSHGTDVLLFDESVGREAERTAQVCGLTDGLAVQNLDWEWRGAARLAESCKAPVLATPTTHRVASSSSSHSFF